MNADEHVQRYVSPDGTCWAASCRADATFLLTSRAAPDSGFPDGLLVEAAYCLQDAFGFARAVAGWGAQFISIMPHPGEDRAAPPQSGTPAPNTVPEIILEEREKLARQYETWAAKEDAISKAPESSKEDAIMATGASIAFEHAARIAWGSQRPTPPADAAT